MENKIITYKTVINQLLEEIPAFKRAYTELCEYFGNDVGQHHIFWEFKDFVLKKYKEATDNKGITQHKQAMDIVNKAINFLDTCLKSDDEKVQELAVVSFLENLGQAGEDYDNIKKLLTPALREELERNEKWWAELEEFKKQTQE